MANEKTERQLLFYEICFTSQEVNMKELMEKLGVGKRTVERYMADFSDAGLLRFSYLRKYNTYHCEDIMEEIREPEGTRRYGHLRRLRRLAIFMEELSGAGSTYIEEYNCRKRYFELFPDVSERTRMRDYATLQNIGYMIEWDAYEKRHRVEGYLYDRRE